MRYGFLIGEISGHIINFGLNVWNWITVELPQIIQSIVDWFAQLPGRIWDWLFSVALKIAEWGINVYNTASTWIMNTINSIIDWFAQLPGRIWDWLCNAAVKIAEWGVNTYNTAVNWISNTVSAVIDWFAQLPGRIWIWLCNTITNVVNWGKDMANKAKQAAQDLFNNVVNTIKELPNKMLNIGKNIVEGIWNGIKNAKDWIINNIKNFARGIFDGMKNALGIHSPSTLFRDGIGRFIPQGVAVGIEADTDEALKAVNAMNDDIINEMNRAVAVETGSINAKASVKANNSMMNIIQATFNIDGSIEADGEIFGRILTPHVTRTLRTAGVV